MMHDYEYVNVRRVKYKGGATFIPVCCKCGRFVKPHKFVRVSEGLGLKEEPNATCKHCGETNMPFEGFI